MLTFQVKFMQKYRTMQRVHKSLSLSRHILDTVYTSVNLHKVNKPPSRLHLTSYTSIWERYVK